MERQKMHECDSMTRFQMKRALTRVLISGGRGLIIAPDPRPAHFRPAPFSPPRPSHHVPTHFPAHKAKLSRSCYCLNTAGDAHHTDAQHTRRTKANPRGVEGASNEGRTIIWIGNPKIHKHITAAHTSWQGDDGARVAFHRPGVHHDLKLINHANLPRHIATDRYCASGTRVGVN